MAREVAPPVLKAEPATAKSVSTSRLRRRSLVKPLEYFRNRSVRPLRFLSSPSPSVSPSSSESAFVALVSCHVSKESMMLFGQSPALGRAAVYWEIVSVNGRDLPSPSVQPLRLVSSTPSSRPSPSVSGLVGLVTEPAAWRDRSSPLLLEPTPGTAGWFSTTA